MGGIVGFIAFRRVLRFPLVLASIVALGAIIATPGSQRPASAAGETTKIVLVGDSYSAGNGAGNYYGPAGCYRSSTNWAERYADWIRSNGYPVERVVNAACSGATTSHFLHYQGNLPPQINAIDESTDLVLLTFGGNDMGFNSIVKQCLVSSTNHARDCRNAVDAANDLMKGGVASTLGVRLTGVLRAIHFEAPSAKIVLLGYPHLAGDYDRWLESCVLHCSRINSSREVRELNRLGTQLQGQVVNGVNAQWRRNVVTYIGSEPDRSVAAKFHGREPYTGPRHGYAYRNPDRWLLSDLDNTPSWRTWYHPKPEGHNAYFELLRDRIGLPVSVPTPVPNPAPNQSPRASFTYKRLVGAGNRVSFNGTGSSDPDGSVTSWRWTIGSTTIATGPTPTVALGAGTSKTVTLRVTDNQGAIGAVTKTLALPNRAPIIRSVAPANGSISGTNTPVLSASATDDDADPLQFSFRVTGPSVDISSGWVGSSWTVPPHRLDPGTRYQWTVTARDPFGAAASRTTTFTVAMLPTAADVIPTSTGGGYWQVASDGGVFSYGDARFHGSVPGLGVRVDNIMGMARTPTDNGYWLVGRDGGVFAFGDAPFSGSLPGLGVRVANIVGMAPTRTGKGYWLVGRDGGVFAFGDAGFFGSMGDKPLNAPVEGIVPTPTDGGYWLAARDGGIFTFGDAPFYGSMGDQPLNAPVVDLDATPDGKGYWMTAEDGGVFAFGNAGFFGSLAGTPLNGHITGMAATPNGKGYFLNGCDGGVFAFGNAVFRGSNPTYQCRGVW